jgi:hypothetical protein
MKKLYLFFITLIFFTSCKKDIEHASWEANISKKNANSLPELFNQTGSERLLEIISSKDQNKISNYNKLKADQIASYFYEKYKLDIRDEFVDNPEGIIILGMIYAAKEYEDKKLKRKSNSLEVMKTSDEEMNCFFVAVESVIGIAEAKSIWRSITMGASKELVISSVSLIGKRVIAVWSLAVLIYNVGGCLEWW